MGCSVAKAVVLGQNLLRVAGVGWSSYFFMKYSIILLIKSYKYRFMEIFPNLMPFFLNTYIYHRSKNQDTGGALEI